MFNNANLLQYGNIIHPCMVFRQLKDVHMALRLWSCFGVCISHGPSVHPFICPDTDSKLGTKTHDAKIQSL